MKSAARYTVASTITFLCAVAQAQPSSSQRNRLAFDIHAKQMEEALTEFAQATQLQVLFQSEVVREQAAPAVSGSLTAEVALQQLLANSGLRYEFVNTKTVAIRAGDPRATLVSTGEFVGGTLLSSEEETDGGGTESTVAKTEEADEQTRTQRSEKSAGIPQILVRGSRSLNTDIRRTEDDIQPYVVLDREAIQRSGATNVQDLISTKLTAAAGSIANDRSQGTQGNSSTISLRGLGEKQTLILIDGRRAPSGAIQGIPSQPDINGIPLSAIERIEVLPTTASGIYGGSATGGVVNVVLRHDYTGLEAGVTYQDSFRNDGQKKRVDFSGGFSLGAKTNVLFTGSYAEADDLLVGDRDLTYQGRQTILANNRAAYFGPSAAPPLSATTNIRSNGTLVNGARPALRLKQTYGGATLPSSVTYVPYGYAGVGSDNGAALVANAGNFNFDLADTAQSSGGKRQSLLTAPKVSSAMLSIRHELTDRLDLFAEVYASRNYAYRLSNVASSTFTLSAASAANPFTDAIVVTTPAYGADQMSNVKATNYRTVAGLIVRLPDNWTAGLDLTWGKNKLEVDTAAGLASTAATAAISSGSINIFRDTSVYPVSFESFMLGRQGTPDSGSSLVDVTARVGGTLARIWAGDVKLSALLEHRKESFDPSDFFAPQEGFTVSAHYNARSQSVDSVYLETTAPLVSSSRLGNDGELEPLLDLQLAGRLDRYRTDGSNQINTSSTSAGPLAPPAAEVHAQNEFSSVDPTVGLRFRPIRDVMLRTSFGTGFLPPSVSQLVPSAPTQFTAVDAATRGLKDPLRGGETLGAFQTLNGGNPDLQPEESKTWSAGFVLTPSILPGLRMSLDWSRISKRGEIKTLNLSQATINNEPFVPGLIQRAAPIAGDPYGVGRITSISNALLNFQRSHTEAYDATLSYAWQSSFGEITFQSGATRQVESTQQLVPSVPEQDQLGIFSIPEWAGNATLTWRSQGWTAAWSTQYLDSTWLTVAHSVDASQASAKVSSAIFHDVYGSYRFSGDSQILSRLEVAAGVKNVFDRKARFYSQSSFYYDPHDDPTGALFYINVKKSF